MVVKGIFNRYVYGPDEDDGYAIVRIKIERGKYIIGCSKNCCVPLGITENSVISLKGSYSLEKQFGYPFTGEPVFVFTAIDIVMPEDVLSAVEYLTGMDIKGIKETLAEKIVSVTGPNLSKYVLFNPDPSILTKSIKGLSKNAADSLYRKIQCASAYKDFFGYISKANISYKQSFKLYNTLSKEKDKMLSAEEAVARLSPSNSYGTELPDVYELCERSGFLFSESDSLARLLGYRPYNPARLRAFVYAVLKRIAENGHVWTAFKDVYRNLNSLISRTAFPDTEISKYAILSVIKNNPKLFKITDSGAVYLSSLYNDEMSSAYNAKRIKRSGKKLNYDETVIDDLENTYGVRYSDSQRRCFGFLRRGGLKIITGEAGTGKTTIISGLIEAYIRLNPNMSVALCAPTGRAAQRMTELSARFGSNIKAATIHRLLEFEPFGDSATAARGENNPLDADFIVVDEMSMVDISLFSMLLKAVKDGALLILCGDAEQLPSVSAGMVFRDMISSGIFETVKLDVNYRQTVDTETEGLIVRNAIEVNRGKTDLKNGYDFEIKVFEKEEQINKEVIKLIDKNPKQTILTPIRMGQSGTNELNRVLQPIINHNDIEYWFGKTKFVLGDKIIMNRNNYDVGYVNGDVGTITQIISDGVVIKTGNEEKRIVKDCLPDMSLAYAMTIHKSQGSEYESVIIILPKKAEHMIARNILYTAITRAKKQVTILTVPGMIDKAIMTTKDNERRTSLKKALCA